MVRIVIEIVIGVVIRVVVVVGIGVGDIVMSTFSEYDGIVEIVRGARVLLDFDFGVNSPRAFPAAG
jgi:hypothetical protein